MALTCCVLLFACASSPTSSLSRPEDIPQSVSLTQKELDAAVTPANAFNLSERERKLCVKKATKGDITAARKLARFYLMHCEGPQRTTLDDRKADYWLGVVDRLEKTAANKARRKK
jgi:hypothetical protein